MNIYRFGMIQYWYDRSTRCWWAAEFDADGNQEGDAVHAYTKDEITREVMNMEKARRERALHNVRPIDSNTLANAGVKFKLARRHLS